MASCIIREMSARAAVVNMKLWNGSGKVPMHRRGIASIVVALIALFYASTPMAQPSFDCKTNRKPDEVAVCNDPALSSLDQEQAAIYTRLRAALAPELATALRESQLSWLRARRACGSDQKCLATVYRDRIATLSAQLTESSDPRPIGEVRPGETANDVDQDETKLILEVIANALKCPVPMSAWTLDGRGMSTHVVHHFTGTATVFSFETRSSRIDFSGGSPTRTETLERISVPIKEIGKIPLEIEGQFIRGTHTPSRAVIRLECRARRDCIEKWHQKLCEDRSPGDAPLESCGTTNRMPMYKSMKFSGTDNIYLCDRETAATLAEALKALRDKAPQ
jgi:uncharacterized protein